MTKIGFVGVGNMNGAIYKALLESCNEKDLLVSDLFGEKMEALGIPPENQFLDFNEMFKSLDGGIIILGIKPQGFGQFRDRLSVDISSNLIVSIMAGVGMEKLEDYTGSERVVRAMPNLAAQVGQSMTGWIASEEVTDKDKNLVQQILASFGEEIEVKNESNINKITALSGSGPAYFFFLTELLEQKALEFGLNEEQAAKIAKTTFLGAAKALQAGGLSPREYKNAVKSKGGTTEAALNHLSEKEWDKNFKVAIEEAKKRAEELGQ